MPSSVRLRNDQIRKLRGKKYYPGDAEREIRRAIERWKRGDFDISAEPLKDEPTLKVFPLSKPLGVESWKIRQILDKHWATEDKILNERCDRNIKKLTKYIDEYMRNLPSVIIEN